MKGLPLEMEVYFILTFKFIKECFYIPLRFILYCLKTKI